MLPLIGAITGLLSGALPEVIKYFKQRQDNKHELEILKLQMQAQAQGHMQRMEAINAEADIRQEEILAKMYEPKPVTLSGVKWIDGFVALLNGIADFVIRMTRPLVTFGFTGLYANMKLEQVKLLGAIRAFDENDQAVFSVIIGHWFGARSMQKFLLKAK